MCDPNYRLFMPVAEWYTRRSDITLQREMNLAEGVPAPMTAEELRHLIDTGQAFPAPAWGYCVQYGGSGRYFLTMSRLGTLRALAQRFYPATPGRGCGLRGQAAPRCHGGGRKAGRPVAEHGENGRR